jgi:hypothetical protein
MNTTAILEGGATGGGWTKAGLLLLVLGAAACSPSGPNCDLQALPGILLTLTDAPSGAPPASSGAEITVSAAGGYVESITVEGIQVPGPHTLAEERAGVYEVVVTAEGYQEWSASSVRVRQGVCHVETVELTAALVPEE